MLFQPPDLLPLDSGDFSVPVHVPKRRDHQSGQELYSGEALYPKLACKPVHVEHGWELKLIVDLLGSSKRLVELKS